MDMGLVLLFVAVAETCHAGRRVGSVRHLSTVKSRLNNTPDGDAIGVAPFAVAVLLDEGSIPSWECHLERQPRRRRF